MAISRIPGVGPTNSDIAATIATTPAVSAQITANVPTAAAIATAVAAPSLAQITTAITSNAASAGVTMAAITSTVQANAGSPYGGTWTNVATTSANSVSSITVSGLTGYKFLKIVLIYDNAAVQYWRFRLNGDTGANYNFWFGEQGVNGFGYKIPETGVFWRTDNPGPGGIDFDIPQANGTGHSKYISYTGTRSSNRAIGSAVWNNTAAISSITFYSNNGGTFDPYIRVYGAN